MRLRSAQTLYGIPFSQNRITVVRLTYPQSSQVPWL